ncbi:MAG: zinc ribbon domain-containing protein [Treponema sp.]|nr:zinc ribbon domain-containing protein [Treponema sp.]
MKAGEVFSKTMPFAWAKLMLGLLVVVISIVILAVLMGIAWLFKSEAVGFVMFIIWLSVTGIVNFIINHYLGYLLKAGHVAVITEAVTTGRIPDNQVAYGKEKVKERFLTSNIYFVVDKLVAGAVRQIQRAVEKLGNVMGGFIPGMDGVMKIAKMFISIALGYIDECCLGYTFLKKDQSAFKSAADGVVIYAQNWKKLLANAAKTTAIVVVLIVVITLTVFILFGLLIRIFNFEGIIATIAGFAAFLLAVFVAWAVKKAFIDSYMMVSMMVSYMEVAPSTQITFDIYGKLCGWSNKFKELFNKGQKESPIPQGAPAMAGTAQPAATTAGTNEKPIFCGECGAKNKRGAKFCGGCGKAMA